ncbi:Transcriptional regulatory protein OmpR [compost metagenome]
MSAQGLVITLGSSDDQVLRVLLDHPNRALSRYYLPNHVYGKEHMPFDRSIDVCISRLRQHLEVDTRNPLLIKTIRNTAYMLTAQVSFDA